MSNNPAATKQATAAPSQPAATKPKDAAPAAPKFPPKMGHYLVLMEPGKTYADQRNELVLEVSRACRESKGSTKSVIFKQWNEEMLKIHTIEGFFNDEIMAVIRRSKATKAVDSAANLRLSNAMEKLKTSATTTTQVQKETDTLPRGTWFQSHISHSAAGTDWECPKSKGAGVTIYVVEAVHFWLTSNPTLGESTEFQGRNVRNMTPGKDHVTNCAHGQQVSQYAAGNRMGMAPGANVVTACPDQDYVDDVIREYLAAKQINGTTDPFDMQTCLALSLHGILKNIWIEICGTGTLAQNTVINCSWGVWSAKENETDALRFIMESIARCVTIVTAAGNLKQDLNTSPCIPANMKEVLTVGGLDLDGKQWRESNSIWGSATGTAVDIWAPATRANFLDFPNLEKGTSLSAASTSGVAACCLADNFAKTQKWLEPAELKERLIKNCITRHGLPNLTASFAKI